MPKVLVIDDDKTVRRLVEKALEGSGIDVISASSAAEGLHALKTQQPDALLLDIMLPDGSGLELVQQIRAIDPRLPVTFITVSDDSDKAIGAMTLGAYDFLLKPLEIDRVQQVVRRALETRRMMQKPVHLLESERDANEIDENQDALVGRSPRMQDVYKEIGRIASQNVSVLICGESGTGKELVARAIYQHSQRRDACFLAVNCAALSDTLLESELFGHEKGAFTGADRRQIGKFEQCDGGTIFLDEVGDMSPLTQSKVLRLLQEQRFERVGGSETIKTDVRIISATNRELEKMISDGAFRLDLYHRLNGYSIFLPPLRERGEDVVLLAEHFLRRMNSELGKEIQGISDDALTLLKNYRWPGNVRELQGALSKAMLKATGPVLVPDFFPQNILNQVNAEETAGNFASARSAMPGADGGANANSPSSNASQSANSPQAIGHNGHYYGSSASHKSVGFADQEAHDLEQFVNERRDANSNDLYAETLTMMERYLLTRVLRETAGNQSQASERLGITRGSLRHKIRTLGIVIEHVVQPSKPKLQEATS